jgi:GT2 family glycosyltransferase
VTLAEGRRSARSEPIAALESVFRRSGPRTFCGHVVSRGDPTRRFSVEISLDGCVVRVVRADAYVDELAAAGVGDGRYGFFVSLDENALAAGGTVEARLANLGVPVGGPVALAEDFATDREGFGLGAVRWLGGLRFSGWIAAREEAATVDALVDGVLVARVLASTFGHVAITQDEARPVRAFDLHLPESIADGNAHWLTVTDGQGRELAGSPLAFLAFADGLRQTVLGRGRGHLDLLRAELFDRHMPMSMPFTDYPRWRENRPPPAAETSAGRSAVVLIGSRAAARTLASLDEQAQTDWIAAALPPTPQAMAFNGEDLRQFLLAEARGCDFVLFVLAGTVLAPDALTRFAAAFAAFPQAEAAYADFDVASASGAAWPIALSAFDYERMLEQGYGALCFALRPVAALRALAREASSLYRLFNAVFDDAAAMPVVAHLPGAVAELPILDQGAAATLAQASLAHLQRRGVEAEARPKAGGLFPAVHVARRFVPPRTTIVIPTRNRHELLAACLASIEPAVERQKASVLVVDNDSSDPETLAYLAEIEGKVAVLRVPGEFNFSRLNNHAARIADADVLCLLNNDVVALDDAWLEEMSSRMTDEDVGAVGALLLWPSGSVQHGGIVLGPQFEAAHAFKDRIAGDVGYGDLLCVAHECSAVTAACLLTRRRDYLAVGGLDEIRFPINFNDVDYCLKLRARGRRIVFTPHARLRHREQASRGRDLAPDRRARFDRELANLRAKWGAALSADPYYSPMLSLDAVPFAALAWPYRTMDPRIQTPPVPTDLPPGL